MRYRWRRAARSISRRLIRALLVVLDIKTPDSGESERNLWGNLAHLKRDDQIKFVICSRADYDWSKSVLAERQLDQLCEVLFSPSWGQLPGPGAGGVGACRPVAGALPAAAAQVSLGRCAGALSMSGQSKRAVVLLSGGMDSAICLAMARRDGYRLSCAEF